MPRKILLFVLLSMSSQAVAQTPVNVVQNPTATQTIVQPPATTFSTNNEAGIVYVVSSYNWVPLSPGVMLTAGVPATIGLSSCPAGLWVPSFAAPFTRIWIADGSKSEAVVLTSPSSNPCPLQGGGSGNIKFTPVNTHSANAYTLGPASQGIQEAINAANITVSDSSNQQLGKVIIPPGEYTTMARVSTWATSNTSTQTALH